jgi:transcription elongation factor Elf1
VPLPPACPECGDSDVDIVTVPPSNHAYEGWETAIECGNCDERIFARELDT